MCSLQISCGLMKFCPVKQWSGYYHILRSRLPGGGSPKFWPACCNYPLVPGNSYKSLDTVFCVIPYTISLIIPEACHAIIAAYGDELMKLSATSAVKAFEDCWNFPYTIGAIDGKHICQGTSTWLVHTTSTTRDFSLWLSLGEWMLTINSSPAPSGGPALHHS